MSIKKVLTDAGTDVPMEHHVINSVNAMYQNAATYITVSCYFSKAAYESGKRALHQDQILVAGLPGDNEDVIDWAQGKLIEAVDPDVNLNQYVNRWMLSGGEIVDRIPAKSAVDAAAEAAAVSAANAAASASAAQSTAG